ncbi:MAG: nucleotidyl transferase AbiEii/AbiGii toxin family protein [Lachnospiraceae bacterium]|nr:nucleotidyl transferase AbiEii/AbiGii toxin family protein [Lachnospiraceae bacterium]
MAYGTEMFKQHFRDFAEQYVLIGGTACDLLLNEAGMPFRATKDIDMVLVVEALTTDFAKSFWQFIDEGGYTARQRSNGQPEFYRFVEPITVGYPAMLELFARPGSGVEFSYTGHLMPLHINDEVSSLSAILLNDSYYDFLLGGRTISEGISVLDAAHLIPMKMKAWIDLTEQKSKGIHVNDRDLRKHRQDVFRLFPLITGDEEIIVPTQVHEDIQSFIETVETLPFEPKNIGIKAGKEDILNVYRTIYRVNE